MIYDLGPRARRIHAALRASILSGERAPGDRLPSHLQLASEYRVAPMTMRHVLAQLEAEGLVSREHGRGTFVRARVGPGVLIVDDEPVSRLLLLEQVRQLGQQALAVPDPTEALAMLRANPSIALVLSDVRMPTALAGIDFIRAVRRRWPEVPLAAVTAHAEDLAPLVGSPDCPLLILSKPVQVEHLEQTLRLARGLAPSLAA